ncbi:hypothetical protein ES288_A10G203400v1 [Gossypium darwinii]|uniref:DUF4371 domain-containing protein n=1 Tax=Gossypium darwinii TaxID=34276 RepID=A0A5D2F1E1_GOSDA|nr:hypothetical protein ES288_A10G203400v1 [Gossypium darwinii]
MINENSSTIEVNTSKCPRLESEGDTNLYFDINNLEQDPRLYEVIQAYLKMGSYQICLSEYPLSADNCQDLLNQPLHIEKIINAQSLDKKKILHILANKVRHKIRKDIGDSKFCIVIDEASITLKEEICVVSRHCLDVQNIQGQGYDGARKMRDEWNGLQVLVLNDCLYAYYVHYLAHRFQLTLVVASREVIPTHNLFSDLDFIVNLISASRKHDQLQAAQAIEIANMLAIDELETSKGLKQIGIAEFGVFHGETHWSSHFSSIFSLIRMFDTTCSVLENVIESGSNYSIRGDAIKETMAITDILCQHLHKKSQDIVNLREDGWDNLLEVVKDMDSPYVVKRGSRYQHVDFNMEHHYCAEIFNAAIDSQLLELNSRFNE